MAEALALPLLLLRHDGLLLNANMAGYTGLAQGAPLRCLDGHVVPTNEAQRDAFQATLLDALLQGSRQWWRGSTADDETMAEVTLTPVLGQHKGAPPMLLLMLPAEASVADGCTLFAYQYGLSPGELSVLHGLCHGRTPRDMAQERGVSVSTVRTQLARLRRKSGAHSLTTLLPRVVLQPPVLPAR